MILNSEALRKIFARKGVTYAPDSVIFLEEDTGSDMFLIVSGEVEITKTYKERELFSGARLTLGSVSETVAILGPGEFFGEMALLNETKRMATARARVQVETIRLNADDLQELVQRSPGIAVQMLKSVCQRLRDAMSSPRVDIVQDQLAAAIQDLQARTRAARPAATAEPKTRPEPAERRRDKAGQEAASPADPASKTCSCGRIARDDDAFCGRCGQRFPVT